MLLYLCRKVAYLVKEQRAAIGFLPKALFSAFGSSERSFLMLNKLSQQALLRADRNPRIQMACLPAYFFPAICSLSVPLSPNIRTLMFVGATNLILRSISQKSALWRS